MQRAWQAVVAMGLIVAAPPGSEAAPADAVKAAPRAEIPGEDDELYRCAAARGEVKVSFRPGLELAELTTWAMSFTCKSFVYSPRLAARSVSVTVMAPRPMSAPDAWRLFLVALQNMDLTIVPKGRVLEIVEAPTAKKRSLPVYPGGEGAPGSEELVRVLLRPRAATSANLAQALAPLLSSDGEIVDVGWAGVVLVTDHGSHIARMRELIEEIDRPGSQQVLYFLPLRHAVAHDLVDTLRALLSPEQGRGPGETPPVRRGASPTGGAVPAPAPALILADERTNALILLATSGAYDRTRALVERLDVDVEGAGSEPSMHVYFLQNGNAEKMAATLSGLLGQRGAGPVRPTGPGAGGHPPPPAADRSVSLQGEVRVTADALSNALLVLSSERDYVALQDILRRIDTPRDQVFIEALIIEVGSGWSRQIGAAWHGGRVKGDALWMGALGGDQLSSFLGAGSGHALQPPVGFLGGVIGQRIPGMETLLGTSLPSFSVLFQALAQSHHVDILSAPHVMTTDHVVANLSSAEVVPFQTGVTGLPGTTGVPFGSVERKDIGLTFNVTPHVGASGRIQLDIDLTIEDVLPQPGPFGPSTSRRHIQNSVVVGDQESAILGGLVTRKLIRRETRIPLLGDLPVLGALFRQRETGVDEANLIVLVTPYIVTDSVDGARAVERVLEGRAEFLGALERLGATGFRARPDGRRMRGLVAEIALRVAQADQEREVLRKLDRRGPGPGGPIEPTSAPVTSAPVATDAAAAVAPGLPGGVRAGAPPLPWGL
ncbi:MAG TPA: type II secretion system secretin GspD [Kofleriaceae bacterium]|nr:type II secretion system secretin GspD [Kofleriaceae bacterium]